MLSRVAPAETPKIASSESENPFLVEPADESSERKDVNGTPSTPSSPRKITPRLPALDGIEWRIAHGLLITLFSLAQAYVARGSPREAEYFAQQAKDVAESLNTPAMVGRALARVGEIYLHLHQVEESHASLMKAAAFAAGTAGPDAAEINRLRAEHSMLHSDGKQAQQLYEQAMSILEDLDGVFATLDGQMAWYVYLCFVCADVYLFVLALASHWADTLPSPLGCLQRMKLWPPAFLRLSCGRTVSHHLHITLSSTYNLFE